MNSSVLRQLCARSWPVLRSFSVVLLFAFGAVRSHSACKFTPLEWQGSVRTHSDLRVLGQRKHVEWVRDANQNFIDDEIEQQYGPGQIVNVVVDLNDCMRENHIRENFQRYGTVQYVGKLVTYFLLGSVRYENLDALAADPHVAMIEFQTTLHLTDNISSRATQSRSSVTYGANSAQTYGSGYNGNGVVIAIVDSGLDHSHEAFQRRIVAGYNPFDPADPGDGSSRPQDDNGHGTHVAGIALGMAPAPRPSQCRVPPDGTSPVSCEGMAPAAGLVVVKVCDQNASCPYTQMAAGLDWVGVHKEDFNIRVANLSIGGCSPDDGSSALAQEVNYLVAHGIAVSVSHGNAGNCGVAPGTTLTGTPGSASYAITVAGTYDSGTVSRTDDTIFFSYLNGPRYDFSVANPNLSALKPDISAPGQNIFAAQAGSPTGYVSKSGTSMAAPHVAGALALAIQARPAITAGNAKELLMQSADNSKNVPQYPSIDLHWDRSFGEGMLDAYKALATATSVDVKFPSCIVGPGIPGGACTLNHMPPWDNRADISTGSPPRAGVANAIIAQVENTGNVAVIVKVRFGIYRFAAGATQFYDVGTQLVTLPPNKTTPVAQPWIPAADSHQCAQVTIDFPFDTDFSNNVTQRNLGVSASEYTMQVENPYMERANFEIKLDAPPNWVCSAKPMTFSIDPLKDCPETVNITFNAPQQAPLNEPRSCKVSVYATKQGSSKQELIGGVTVDTLKPGPCQVAGRLLDVSGSPLSGVQLEFSAGSAPTGVTTGGGGTFSLDLLRLKPYAVVAKLPNGDVVKGSFQALCGPMVLQVVKTAKGMELLAQ